MDRHSTNETQFPCNRCGADLRFEPGTDRLSCDHCGNEERIEDGILWSGSPLKELDFQTALQGALPESEHQESQVLNCKNCGAQVEFEPDTHAAECPFCATPVVTDTGTHRHIKPRGLLPFGLREQEARDAMNRWLGRLWFAPSGLNQYARSGRRLQGIYVPYWTFDADTKTRYKGQRGDVYHETQTRTVTVNGKRQRRQVQVQKVRWRNASGRVSRFFDDVLVLASKALPRDYTEALGPWDLSMLTPYRPEYLAGFRAEGYTVELDEGYHDAKSYMDRMILRDIRFDIGGDRQRIDHVDTNVSDITFKHVLLPIWVAAYKYRGRTYRFVVNGRTGVVRGERPFSAFKIGLAVLVGLLVAGAIGFLIAINQDPEALRGMLPLN